MPVDLIQEIDQEIRNVSWANLYREYLNLRDKGLKVKGKAALLEFTNVYKNQSSEDRRSFIDIVFKAAFLTDNYSTFLPTNLYDIFFLPELKAWQDEAPENPIPLRWSTDLKDIKKAIQIKPNDPFAIEIYANRVVGRIYNNQHEIKAGFGYNGNPTEDISELNFLESHIDNFLNDIKKNNLKVVIRNLKTCAVEHLNKQI